MDSGTAILAVNALHWISTAFELIAGVRIIQLGLGARFRFLCALLLTDSILSIPMLTISAASTTYLHLWGWKQPIYLALLGLAAYETCALLAESYSKARFLHRSLAVICLTVGIAAAMWVGLPELLGHRWREVWIAYAIARKTEAVSIASSMLAATLFFAVIPAPVRRNSEFNGKIFAVFAVTDALAYFAVSTIGPAVQIAQLLIYTGCFVSWTFLLSRSGDELQPLRTVTDEEFRDAEKGLEDDLDRFRTKLF